MRLISYILSSVLFLGSIGLQAQTPLPCQAGELRINLIVQTDNFPQESAWQLVNSNSGTVYYQSPAASGLAQNTVYDTSFCVPASAGCLRFVVTDSYGDGLCCNYGPGYYRLVVNGDTLAAGGAFTNMAEHFFNCPPGSSCTNADSVGLGTYTSSFDDHWYRFVPDQNGRYEISTCSLNTCNTQIWVYDNCSSLVTETYTGTMFFDDDDGGCGLQAVVYAVLEGGRSYYIRIGDHQNNCTSNQVGWSLNYLGPVTGCMDPSACNYNPLATVSDTCIYPGSPDCPTGPDLLMRQDVLRQSLQVANYNSTDPCMVDEECIAGLGTRTLLRFTTRIDNIGTQDYYAGNATTAPHLFNNQNCHGHWHYTGYAEYMLFDQQRNPIPVGFKNGFCVMDLTCPAGIQAQYGCSNMGISAGCADIYDRSLDCQWIDLTDIPDGAYTFITRVNWNYSPDAAGRYEVSYDNNWAQACIILSRASGSLVVTQDPNCPDYTDCMGQPFGSAMPDCQGICNGPNRRGDLNADQQRNQADLAAYATHLLAEDLSATNCNDLHADGSLNLFDLALLQRCLLDSTRCNLPGGIVNIFDTVGLSILQINHQAKTIDIGLRNPSASVLGYQFRMSGVDIDSVTSLQGANYPVQIQWSNQNKMVLAYSSVDSSVLRSNAAQPLCRIHYSQFTGPEACIDSIYSMVSKEYQALQHRIEGDCVLPLLSGLDALPGSLQVQVMPNPSAGLTYFRFQNRGEEILDVQIFDATGRLIFQEQGLNGREWIFDASNLAPGVYAYRFTGQQASLSGRLIVKD